MVFKKIFRVVCIVFLTILICILSMVLILFTKSINEVKDIDINLSKNTTSVCKIYNNNGELINDKINLVSNYVELEDVSPYLVEGFISIEDKKFYKHNGLNYLRIAKAMVNNITAGSFVEGASTISQQLIKNKYLTNEKSISRKIKEMYLTLKMEAQEDKDTIIESYINTIYYGNGAYGISNASSRFFNKLPNELSLSECATLVGIVKSPAKYSPLNDYDNSIGRRNLVLKEMYKDGLITKSEYVQAVNEKLELDIQEISNYNSLDLYSKKVINEACEILNMSKYEILNKGYSIYTYQDKDEQNILDSIVNNDAYYDKNEYGNIADNLTMIIENKTAGITAISGRSRYDLTSFKRQPGSLIKPILVYTPAFEERLIYPSSQILDEKITINNYSPHNVSDKYYGYVSIRDAVAKSLNVPAVKLCDKIGVEKCKSYAEKAGIIFAQNDTGLAIALGGLTEGVSLEEITNSYIPYSNDGEYQKCGFIKEIKTPQNITIYAKNKTIKEYCSKESAYLMTESLIYSSKSGTSNKLKNLEYNVASKTGTVNIKNTNYNTDAYSLAYTTKHTVSTWFGNYSMDEKFNLKGSNNGGTFATEIIKDILEDLYKNNKPKDFEIPDTIISLPIDTLSLKNNNEIVLGYNSPIKYQKYEIFASDNLPPELNNDYEEVEDTELKISNINDTITLYFNAREYLEYELFKVDNYKDILIQKFNSQKGLAECIISSFDYNKDNKYYLLIRNPYSNKIKKSNIVYTYIQKDYNNLIDNINHINNFNWLFE